VGSDSGGGWPPQSSPYGIGTRPQTQIGRWSSKLSARNPPGRLGSQVANTPAPRTTQIDPTG